MAKYPAPLQTLGLSKVFQRGKTQIPKEVRQVLGIKDRDKILWYFKDREVYVKKAE